MSTAMFVAGYEQWAIADGTGMPMIDARTERLRPNMCMYPMWCTSTSCGGHHIFHDWIDGRLKHERRCADVGKSLQRVSKVRGKMYVCMYIHTCVDDRQVDAPCTRCPVLLRPLHKRVAAERVKLLAERELLPNAQRSLFPTRGAFLRWLSCTREADCRHRHTSVCMHTCILRNTRMYIHA